MDQNRKAEGEERPKIKSEKRCVYVLVLIYMPLTDMLLSPPSFLFLFFTLTDDPTAIHVPQQ